MSTKNFVILIMVILLGFGGELLRRKILEQQNINLSQERKIDRINEALGIE